MTACTSEVYNLLFYGARQYDHLEEKEFSSHKILNSEIKQWVGNGGKLDIH